MKSLKELKDSGYRAVDFFLSKSCNKNCYYCTEWTLEMRNLTVDMVFLKELLEWFSPHKTRIQLLGGEPGLIKNLPEVINEIKKHENLIPGVLSNSLVRRKHPWVLEDPEIFYYEHLALDFTENGIEKLGPHDFFDANDNRNYNVIIQTPNFFKWKEKHHKEYLALNNKNTQFKEYNSRSPEFYTDHISIQAPEKDRRICAAFPMVPVIDFEIKKIRHCSKRVIEGSHEFDITKDNIDKMMTYELFSYEKYCEKCMDPIALRPKEQILDIIEVGKTFE